MPIYEYRCTHCEHKLEALQKFSDAPLTTCPSCGKETLTKLVTAAGFQLKGSGWYQTDFRGGATPKPSTDDTAGKDAAKASNGSAAESGGAADAPATSAPKPPSGDGAGSTAATSGGSGSGSAAS